MEWGAELVFESELESPNLWGNDDLVAHLGSGDEDVCCFCRNEGLDWIGDKFSSVTRSEWDELTGKESPEGMDFPEEDQWYDSSVVLAAVREILAALANHPITQPDPQAPADDDEDDDEAGYEEDFDEEEEDCVFESHIDGPKVVQALRVLETQLIEASAKGVRCHYRWFEL